MNQQEFALMAAVEQIPPNDLEAESLHLVHEILVLDAFLVKPLDQGRYTSITRDFVADLLNVLGMETLGELGIFPAVDQREPGWSFIQPITTSHVSAHYFENPGNRPHIRIDAYSCASINWNALIQVCHEHFELDEWCACFIDRQLDNPRQRSVVELAGQGACVISEIVLSERPLLKHGANQ